MKVFLKMKLLVPIIVVVVMGNMSYASSTFVYSGRIAFLDDSQNFKDETTKLMASFRLYKDATSISPLWEVTTPIYLDKDGNFQITLGDGMTGEGVVYSSANTKTVEELFNQNAVRSLGVSIEGEAEQYPRQEIHSIPFAVNSNVANDVVRESSVADATADEVIIKGSAEMQDLEITKELTLNKQDFSVNEIAFGNKSAFSTRGVSTELLGSGVKEYSATNGIKKGQTLVGLSGALITGNTTGGFLVIISRENWTCPCVTIPINAYESYSSPFDLSGKVDLRFYSFGN